MSAVNKIARMTGFLYLAFIVTFALATAVRSRLIVSGDAATTAGNILASEWLFRAGFVSEVISAVLFFLAAWGLYVLLAPVNNHLALLFMLLNLGGVVIQCLGALGQFTALLVLGGGNYLKVFDANQLPALAMLFLNVRDNAIIVAQIFFGAWLLPLGYLVYKSGLLPRLLGILLIIDFFGVLIWFCQFFFFPGYQVITYPGLAVSALAEFSLSFWLLFKGVKDQAGQNAMSDSVLPVGIRE